MPQPIIQSKSGQVAQMLRERLASGVWSAGLPPERDLAAEFLVSRTTLRAACAILESEGLLRPCEHTRKGRTPAKPAGQSTAARGQGTVHVLTPSLSDSPILMEHLAVVRGELAKASVTVQVNEIPHIVSQSHPRRALSRLFSMHRGAVWVLHKMPFAIQEIAADLRVPCVVFGSVFPGIQLPFIDIDFAATARHAAGRCFAAGRTRFAMVLHRTRLAGDTLAANEVQRLTREKNYADPILIRHDFNRSALVDTLDSWIARPQRFPDALLVINQHHLITVLPHLLRRGIDIPGRLSLVHLGNDSVVERLSPLPDRYDVGSTLSRGLARMCLALLAGERPANRRLLPRALRGETLG
jgi:DNA-binding LacI/PurR family transcriptional regulator